MNEAVTQAIGFFGVLLFIASYQLRSHRALFLCQLTGCLVFFIQFLLLSWGGALCEGAAAASIPVSIRRLGWKNLGGAEGDS